MKCCADCVCDHVISLTYGPEGNPDSRDPFERAQARAPKGWHVEGQMFGNHMMATTKIGDRVIGFGPVGLIEAMAKAGPR